MCEKTSPFKVCICLIFIASLPAANGYADAIYVDMTNTSGPWDGSATYPYQYIQDGIDDANNGDTVIVRPGLYTGEGNREITFTGKAITLLGISGPNETIIDCEGDDMHPRRGICFNSGEDANSILKGFTITGGYYYDNGTGIYCEESSPTITNCVIIDNGSYKRGGGICYLRSPGTPEISNCRIEENSASDGGGGIYCEDSSPKISNCTIVGNYTGLRGGGVSFVLSPSDAEISNCRIEENTAGEAGGGIYCEDSGPKISNCTIVGNESVLFCGAGICCVRSLGNTEISNCRIESNHSGDCAGGIHFYRCNPTVFDCIIVDNEAETYGGGIYCNMSAGAEVSNCRIEGNHAGIDGGGIAISGSCSITIHDCSIVGNSAIELGGGVGIYGWPLLSNCTITGNSAYKGGGIASYNNGSEILGCEISGNTASQDGGGIYTDSGYPKIVECKVSGNTASAYGGGVYAVDLHAPGTLSGCIINDNHCDKGGGLYLIGDGDAVVDGCLLLDNEAIHDGGGIYVRGTYEIRNSTIRQNRVLIYSVDRLYGGGGLCTENVGNPTLENCEIVANHSNSDGGGIKCGFISSMTLTNCTILDNSAVEMGGGIYSAYGAYVVVTNSILWGNTAETGLQLSLKAHTSGLNPSSAKVTYCDVQAGTAGVWVDPCCSLQWQEGNIDAEPIFEDTNTHNYRLMPGSPCIDAGTSVKTPTEDMANSPRCDDPLTPDTGGGLTTYYDIGANEFRWIYVNGQTGDDSWDGLAPSYTGRNGPKQTIQSGLDVAENGNKVTVAPWTYATSRDRNLNFAGKAIRLISETGAEQTIIDCQGLARGFNFDDGEDERVLVEGFTIRNGSADTGGGIKCLGGSNPTIRNCRIENCQVSLYGGALYCHESSPYLQNVELQTNNAALYGGGIYCYSFSSPVIMAAVIRGNTAYAGAGIHCNAGSSPDILNCRISANAADDKGGGIRCDVESSPIVTNCEIVGNSAGSGGGLYCYYGSSPTITNCTLNKNFATLVGGGLVCYDNADAYLTNSILWGNTPQEIYSSSSAPILNFCDIKGGWTGGGANNIDGDPCFVAIGYWVDANDINVPVEPNHPNAAWIDGDYRLVPDSICVDTGDNNSVPMDSFDVDGDFNTIELIPQDLADHLRVADGDCDGNGTVDIGAYEFSYSYLGDFDNQCDIDFADYALLALSWLADEGQPAYNPVCDISSPANFYIDLWDLRVFVSNWLIDIE